MTWELPEQEALATLCRTSRDATVQPLCQIDKETQGGQEQSEDTWCIGPTLLPLLPEGGPGAEPSLGHMQKQLLWAAGPGRGAHWRRHEGPAS